MTNQSSRACKISCRRNQFTLEWLLVCLLDGADCISHGASETGWGSRGPGRSSTADPHLPSSSSSHISANTQSICRHASFISKYQMAPASLLYNIKAEYLWACAEICPSR